MFVEHHHVRVISDGSCDTEDINNSLKYINIENLFNILIIFHNITVLLTFIYIYNESFC